MNYNPYAPPEAPVASNPPPGGFGQPQPWTAQEALKVAWERFKIHGGVLIFAHFVSGLIVMVLGQISNVVVWTHVVDASTPGYLGVMVAGTVVTQVVAAFFNVGLTRIQLDVARGVTPKLETMFSGADRFLPMLGMNFVFFVAVLVGFLLFIVPGVLLCLVYPLAPYYVVEGGFGPLAALRKAWSASKGQRGELFVLSLYGFGLAILGVLMLFMGLIVTVPLYWLTTAVVFTRVAGLSVAPISQGPMQPLYQGPPPYDLPPYR